MYSLEKLRNLRLSFKARSCCTGGDTVDHEDEASIGKDLAKPLIDGRTHIDCVGDSGVNDAVVSEIDRGWNGVIGLLKGLEGAVHIRGVVGDIPCGTLSVILDVE